ncbi:helix-turn-helix domain-containing protein [Pyramidobacter sp.]|uniref:helix-turn-helix domain-containing protein n=1 Tax=unclassified Pyramidobacter TaxID=2632171 RepID=UPI00331F43F7
MIDENCSIAQCLGRHKSTVSRELKRNSSSQDYSSSVVQGSYYARRKACHLKRKLDNETLKRVRERLCFKQ